MSATEMWINVLTADNHLDKEFAKERELMPLLGRYWISELLVP